MSSTVALVCLSAAVAATDPSKDYASLLKKHVRDGRVAYSAISTGEKQKLKGYLEHLKELALPKQKDAAVAILVDAYNAIVIHSVLEAGIPKSVMDVKGFFSEKKHRVAGRDVSLDDLEKKVINPLAKDPHTHMVLVCAAKGCPILESEPYSDSTLKQRMQRAARRYIRSPAGFNDDQGQLRLSKIFQWYENDFGGRDGVAEFVSRYLPKEKAKKIAAAEFQYLDYDWKLNGR